LGTEKYALPPFIFRLLCQGCGDSEKSKGKNRDAEVAEVGHILITT
jgi:hypothetical protein